MGGRHIKLGELLLGFEGLALLRGLIDGDEADMTARLEDVRRIAAALDEQPYASGLDVPELDVRTGYAEWSNTYDDGGNPLLDVEQPVVEAITSALAPGRALDAACGTGRHAEHLARTHDVTGVDATPEMLAKARERVPAGRFLQGDLLGLPFPDDHFDVITCGLALCHLDPLAPAIAELARVARPGATLVLTDPHPLAVLVLNQALFPTDGGVAFVRNHRHGIAAYIDAFNAAGLMLKRCLEPVFESEHASGLAVQFTPGAMEQAMGGLPFAIVWELEKGQPAG